MILTKTHHVSDKDISKNKYDLIVSSCGYEERSFFCAKNIELNATKKICMTFDKYKTDPNRKIGEIIYLDKGYTIVESSADSYKELQQILSDIVKHHSSEKLKILVDYSSMSRVWYSFILRYFKLLTHTTFTVELTFIYAHSKYINPPSIEAYKSFVSPIDGYYSIQPPIKPTCIILGLGYIKGQGYGLIEYFEAEPYIFINRNSESDLFYDAVIENNKFLLEDFNQDNIFYYTLNNMAYSEMLLNQLCQDLKSNYRIVLAPCGPKPFTLLSLITSIRLGDIDIWRISATNNDHPVNKIASGGFSITIVEYENDK